MQRRSAMRCHNAGRARAWVCKTRLSLLYWGGLVSSAFRLFRRSGVDVARRILASLRDRHAGPPMMGSGGWGGTIYRTSLPQDRRQDKGQDGLASPIVPADDTAQ